MMVVMVVDGVVGVPAEGAVVAGVGAEVYVLPEVWGPFSQLLGSA